MKYLMALLTVAALCTSLAANATADPSDDEARATIAALHDAEAAALDAARWKTFSKNLVHALQSENDGVQMAALQLIKRNA